MTGVLTRRCDRDGHREETHWKRPYGGRSRDWCHRAAVRLQQERLRAQQQEVVRIPRDFRVSHSTSCWESLLVSKTRKGKSCVLEKKK